MREPPPATSTRSAVRSASAHVELYGAGDGARIALAYAARYGDRVRALVLDGGPSAALFGGDGRAEARALAKALGPGAAAVTRLAARLRTHPLHVHGRIDDDVLARLAVRAGAQALAQLPAAATAALAGDALPLARLVADAAPPAARQAAQARASSCHDDAPPAPAARVDGGPFTGPTWLRALGLAACKGNPQPATPDPVLPEGATLAAAPALVLAGEHAVQAPSATLRTVAGLLPSGRYVRVRGAGALPALSDPEGCAGAIARAFLKTRGKVSPGCASRPTATGGVTAFPLTLQAAPAALRDARAHGRDRSTLADRRSATVAALGVADALASAEAPGAPARVKGLRGGSAVVTRRAGVLTLSLKGVRFVRDASLDGIVTTTARRGSVYASAHADGADGSARAVRAHLEHAPDRRATPPPAAAPRAGRCCSSCARRETPQIRPSARTASRSSASSAALASMRAREKSSISRPCTISQRPPEQRTGNRRHEAFGHAVGAVRDDGHADPVAVCGAERPVAHVVDRGVRGRGRRRRLRAPR